MVASFLNKELEHDANVRLRPLTEDETQYLYFPFAYKEDGKGYAVRVEDVLKLRKNHWAPYSFLMAPTLLLVALALFLGRGSWFVVFPAAALGIFLGNKLFQANKRHLIELLEPLEVQPFRLTQDRYYQEMALQTRGSVLWLKLIFWLVFLALMIRTLPQVAAGGLLPLFYFVGLSVSILKIKHTWRLAKLRRQATGNELGSLEGLQTTD